MNNEVESSVNNTQKKSKGPIILIILLLIIIAGLGTFIYLKKDVLFSSNNNGNTNNNQNTNSNQEKHNKSENKKEMNNSIPVEDTYALSIIENESIQLYMIKDGMLYYKVEKCKDGCSIQTWNYLNDEYNNNGYDDKKLKKVDGLNNIKRIKGINLHSDLTFSVLLITEDGKVYIYESDFEKPELLSLLKNYEVDDILELNHAGAIIGEAPKDKFKIITKDGKTISEEKEWTSNLY